MTAASRPHATAPVRARLASGLLPSSYTTSGDVTEAGTYDALHAMDYLVFGQLQLAQDKAAKRVVDEAAAIRKVNVENFVAAYAFAAIPARFALERGDWKEAATLKLSPG